MPWLAALCIATWGLQLAINKIGSILSLTAKLRFKATLHMLRLLYDQSMFYNHGSASNNTKIERAELPAVEYTIHKPN